MTVQPRWIGLCAVVQLVCGVGLTAVASSARSLTTSLDLRNFPVWASIPLMMAGALGLLQLGLPHHPASKSGLFLKVLSWCTSCLAAVLCGIAAVYQSLAVAWQWGRYDHCTQNPGPHCACSLVADSVTRITLYRGAQCPLLQSWLPPLLLASGLLAGSGALAAACHAALLWTARCHYVLTSSLAD